MQIQFAHQSVKGIYLMIISFRGRLSDSSQKSTEMLFAPHLILQYKRVDVEADLILDVGVVPPRAGASHNDILLGRVQNVNPAVGNGPANGNRTVRRLHSVIRGAHRGLGGAVGVVNLCPLIKAVREGSVKHIAPADQHPEILEFIGTGVEITHGKGRKAHDADPMANHIGKQGLNILGVLTYKQCSGCAECGIDFLH